eukprot:1157437-Pelagomonas_calceolata.AAC.2
MVKLAAAHSRDAGCDWCWVQLLLLKRELLQAIRPHVTGLSKKKQKVVPLRSKLAVTGRCSLAQCICMALPPYCQAKSINQAKYPDVTQLTTSFGQVISMQHVLPAYSI